MVLLGGFHAVARCCYVLLGVAKLLLGVYFGVAIQLLKYL